MSQSSELAAVIGASGGIGSAIAAELAGKGSHSLIYAFSRQEPVTRVPASVWHRLDLTDETSIAAAAGQISKDGDLRTVIVASGVLHDAAGMQPEKSLKAIDPMTMARQFAVNATGPALIIKHFAPLLPRKGRSVFAILSARVGSISDNRLGGWYAYRAAKAALNQIIRTASVELARTHREAIIVGLHPGTVSTALSEPFGSAANKTSPQMAAANLLTVVDGLSVSDSGLVFDWRGDRIPA